MTTLTLHIKADDGDVARVQGVIDELRLLLKSPSTTSIGSMDAELARLKTKLAEARVQLQVVEAAQAKLGAATAASTGALRAQGVAAKQVLTSLSGMASAGDALSRSLQQQTLAVGALREQVAGLSVSQRLAAQALGVQEGLLKIQNAEFGKQTAILTALKAKTDEQVVSEQRATAALVQRVLATGELTAAELKRLGVESALVNEALAAEERLAAGRLALREGAARAEIAAEERLAAGRLALREGAAQAEIALEARVAAGRAALKAGANVAAVNREALADLNLAAARRQVSRATVELAAVNMGLASSYTPVIAQTNAATASTAALRSALRGAAGASGNLWFSYVRSFKDLLPLMGAFVTAATAIKGVKLAAEFDYATKYTHTLAAATGDYSLSLDSLRQKLLAVRDTKHAPEELAAASKELVKQGFSAAAAVGEIGTMSKMAAVAEEDLSTITQTVASQYRAWGEEAIGAARGVKSLSEVANIMTFTAMKTAVNIGELAKMMKYTSELSVASGASFVELNAALGYLSNLGIRGTTAATSLRTAITRLQDPTGKARKLMEDLGVSFSAFTEEGKAKTLTQLLTDLSAALGGLSDQNKIRLIMSLFSQRSASAAAGLLKGVEAAVRDGVQGFKELSAETAEIGRELTFLDTAFKGISETVKIQASMLRSDWHRALEEAFNSPEFYEFVKELRKLVNDGVVKDLVGALGTMTTALASVAKFLLENAEAVKSIGAAFAFYKLATWGTVFLGWATGLEKAKRAQEAFNLAALANPYIAAGAAVAGAMTWGFSEWDTKLKEEERRVQTPVSVMDAEVRLRRLEDEIHKLETDGAGFADSAMLGAGTDTLLARRKSERARLQKFVFDKTFVGPVASFGQAAAVATPEVVLDPAKLAHDAERALEVRRSQAKREEQLLQAKYRLEQELLTASNRANLVNEQDYLAQSYELTQKSLQAKRTLLEKERGLFRDEMAAVNAKLEDTPENEEQGRKPLLDELSGLEQKAADAEAEIQALNWALAQGSEVFIKEAAARARVLADQFEDVQKAVADARQEIELLSVARGKGWSLERLGLEQELLRIQADIDAKRKELERAGKYTPLAKQRLDTELEGKTQSARLAFQERKRDEVSRWLRDTKDQTLEVSAAMHDALALAGEDSQTQDLFLTLGEIRREGDRVIEQMRSDGHGEDVIAKQREIVQQQIQMEREKYETQKKLEQDWKSGASAALKDYAREAQDVYSSVGQVATKAIRGIEDAFVDMVTTGKLEFKDLINSILSDLARLAIQKSITGPLAEGLGAAVPWVISSLSSATAPSVSTAMTPAMYAHTGGVIGKASLPTQQVPSQLFLGAPRLHKGLAHDEFPAILQRGEQVIPKDGSLGSVTVTVINNTESTAKVKESRRANGQRDIMVVIGEAMANDVRNGGPLGSSIRQTYGVSPRLTGR